MPKLFRSIPPGDGGQFRDWCLKPRQLSAGSGMEIDPAIARGYFRTFT
ncbi:MAG: hypothetical protein U1G07_06050 [Verrucomicrobiota bacterium]